MLQPAHGNIHSQWHNDDVSEPARVDDDASESYIVVSQKGTRDNSIHQHNIHQFEEKELQYRKELEQKDMLLQQYKVTLQEKERVINLLTQQYDQVKSEKERLQQQIQDYEQTSQQNNEKIEILRRENQAALQDRQDVINQHTQKYEQQLDLLHHVKAESGTEKRLQQQIQDYEQASQRNNEQIEIPRRKNQAALRDKEEAINQLTLQYKQQSDLLCQVKIESGSEKERLQQQIQDFEQKLQQNNEQIEILRENQQGPVLIGPVGEKYQMSKTPHGIAVVINNFKFHSTVPGEDPLPERRGSQVDEQNLRVTWEYLRYDVQILRNLTSAQLISQLKAIALQSHEKYDSFVCCILSHGYPDGVYGTDSKPVKMDDIASLFKGNVCPTLINKPKLFFIQADRGGNEDMGVLIQGDEDKGVPVQKGAKGGPDDALNHSLPSEADFLFGYATPPGNVSWRSPRYGSWYITKLCEVFVDYSPQLDLLSMLTMVNYEVSERYTTQGFKQCPAPVTLLRKKMRFFEM